LLLGFKADVFSFGMILYGLIFGTLQVQRLDINDSTIKWPDRSIPNFSTFVSRAVKDLLSLMLQPDPENRITMEQVLHHPWMQ
jgi:serine/threonine protein kinase